MMTPRSLLLPVVLATSLLAQAYASTSVDPFERMQYSSYPPTVFSPTGRLHMVDSVGLAATNPEDVTAGVVVALRCGDGDGAEDECIVVIGTGPRSALAMQAELLHVMATDDGEPDAGEELDPSKYSKEGGDGTATEPYFESLLVESSPLSSVQSKTAQEAPIVPSSMSILSPDLVVATGGSPGDAGVLLDRITDVASSMHSSHFGGTGFIYQANKAMRRRSGMFGVNGANLARRIADMLQIPTQSVGSRLGGMVASSALILDSSAARVRNKSSCTIWRVDPSGQFFSCDAAAIGRGSAIAESVLMREIMKRTKPAATHEQDDVLESSDEEDPDKDCPPLSNREVKLVLGSLTKEKAIEIARTCILKVYDKELKQVKQQYQQSGGATRKTKNEKDIEDIFFRSLHWGGAILRPSGQEGGSLEVLDL